MKRNMNSFLTVAAITLGLITPAVVSADVLADGSITGGVALQTQAISPTFDIANGPVTFSGTIAVTNRTGTDPGQFKMGFLVQDAFFSFHPGFDLAGRSGAVRVYEGFHSGTKLTILSPGDGSDGDLGFASDPDGTFDFSVLVTDAGSGDVDVSWTVVEGTNSQTFSTFTIASSAMGATGGIFDSFGVGLRADVGSVTIEYTGVQVTQGAATSLYAQWLAGYNVGAFTNMTDDAENGGVGDGLDNLTEYALGSEPDVVNVPADVLPKSVTDATTLKYIYQRQNPKDPNLSYIVVDGTDLGVGLVNTNTSETVSAPVNGFETVTNEISMATQDQQFIQLKMGLIN